MQSIKNKIKQFQYNLFDNNLRKKHSNDIKHDLVELAKYTEIKDFTKDQENVIQEYFLINFGRKINLDWHKYYYSRNDFFSEKYIPNDIYINDLIYRLNNFDMRKVFSDKNLYEIFFSDFNLPKGIIRNIQGVFYEGNNPITREKALKVCYNLDSVIIKPTIDSSWGENVRVLQVKNGLTNIGDLTISEIFEKYSMNFIIQEKIVQHNVLASLNPSSVNTIRVITYRTNEKIELVYAVLRIGRLNQVIDNITAGGMSVKINENGVLGEFGFGMVKEGKFKNTDNGIILKNYELTGFNEVIKTAKEMHSLVPYLDFIGWDFSIDEIGKPVFIELNRSPDLSQSSNGPAFGSFTEEILNKMKYVKNSRGFTIY